MMDSEIARWWLMIWLAIAGAGCGGGRTPLLLDDDPSAPLPSPLPPGPTPPSTPPVPPDAARTCPEGMELCGQGQAALCYDLQKSAEHCGACGKQCPPGIACDFGRCRQYRCRGSVTMKALTSQSRAGLLSQMALADLDGDGFLDLVSGSDVERFWPSDGAASVSAFLGRGDGTFETKATFLVPMGERAAYGAYAAVADLNRDGFMDLVSTSTAKDSVSVRLGAGDGSFGPETDYVMGAGPSGILIADFDDDGTPDIACAAREDGAVSLRFGTGAGRFGERSALPVSGSPRLLARADWDQDGAMDLLAGDDYLHILPGLGAGRFAKAVDCPVSLSHRSKGGFAPPPVFADLDRDGRWDLAVGNGILFGMNQCNLASRVDYDDWWPLLSDDFNGDGLPDLVAVAYPWLLLMKANGTTRLDGPTKLADFFGQEDFATAVAGDLNGDGRLDLVVSDSDGVRVLLNTCR